MLPKYRVFFVFDKDNDKFQLTPLTPSPNPNPSGEIKTVCKWNGSVEDGYWLFTEISPAVGKNKLRFNIAKNHSFFKGKKLDHSLLPFNIKFLESNASKKEGNDSFLFEVDNSNFELTPTGNWPDETPQTPPPYNPTPGPKNENKIAYRGSNSTFALFDDLIESFHPGQKSKNFHISNEHPLIKKLSSQGKLKSFKQFTIRYGIVDNFEDKPEAFIFTFNRNNRELELLEV